MNSHLSTHHRLTIEKIFSRGVCEAPTGPPGGREHRVAPGPQGMIDYWLAQALCNAGVKKPVLGLITQTLVDAADPAFAAPTKFVGPVYRQDRAQPLAHRHCWTIAADNGQWRRVVASPEPLRIVEQDSIPGLLDASSVVICGGGGGAAVTENTAGQLRGVDAVVDKDYVAAVLGIVLGAQHLLVLTDVSAVIEHYGTPEATPLTTLDPDYLGSMGFPAGSMGPKIEAYRRFVIATGRPATIGALADAQALLAGTAGTTPRQRSPTGVLIRESTGGEGPLALALEDQRREVDHAGHVGGSRPT
ncbi:amino acid kinase family protein [Mycobacterium sp.]|uniref:amino acid kinase family protein n=1 Tax=Mycobacterium sp. TaxID=1785 RepID=UPI003F96B68B